MARFDSKCAVAGSNRWQCQFFPKHCELKVKTLFLTMLVATNSSKNGQLFFDC